MPRIAKNRSLSLNLENKYQPISKALWAQKQNENYLNTLQIRNIPSSHQLLLANDLVSKNQLDPILIMEYGIFNLIYIADDKISNYIIDHLDDCEINMMNQKFPSTIETLKPKYSKIKKIHLLI